MKAKYILRGLGLGMIITAVVMGGYTRSAVAAARVDVLKEYGIGEEAALTETLVDIGSDAAEEVQESEAPASIESEITEEESETVSDTDAVQVIERDDESAQTSETEPGEESTVADSEAAGAEDASEAEPANGQTYTVTITIAKGDDSGTVARKLYNAGIVENAAEYDAFLMQHGYDKKLSTGSKVIHVNDSWQEIAEKLTR